MITSEDSCFPDLFAILSKFTSLHLLMRISGFIQWASIQCVCDHACAESVINSRDEEGQTALHYACSNGHTEVVEYLLSCDGVDTTLRSGH